MNSSYLNIGQTTVNGKPAVKGALIFEDTFDTLDFDKWQHEKTLAGGGVC